MTNVIDNVKEAVVQLGADFNAWKEKRETENEEGKAAIDARLGRIDTRIDELNAEVAKAERLCIPGVEAGKHGEKGKFSFARMAKLVTNVADINDPEYGYEKEVNEIMQTRRDDLPEGFMGKTAINAATDTGGAFLISTELQTDLIPKLEAMSITSALGVTRLDGLRGNVAWPKDEGGITAAYIDTEAEETGAESVDTYSQVNLRPHVLAAFVPLTFQMLNQPAIAIESHIANRIALKIALREDLSVFTGSSAESQPRGITTTTGIQTVNWSTAPGTPVFSGASGAQNITQGLRLYIKAMLDENAFEGATKLGWAMSPSSAHAIGLTKDSDGHTIFMGNNDDVLKSLLTHPVKISTQLEQSGNTDEFLMFADWAQVLNAHWGTMAFASSDTTETNFRRLRTTLRAVTAHDVGVLQPKSFVTSSNFNVSATI